MLTFFSSAFSTEVLSFKLMKISFVFFSILKLAFITCTYNCQKTFGSHSPSVRYQFPYS